MRLPGIGPPNSRPEPGRRKRRRISGVTALGSLRREGRPLCKKAARHSCGRSGTTRFASAVTLDRYGPHFRQRLLQAELDSGSHPRAHVRASPWRIYEPPRLPPPHK